MRKRKQKKHLQDLEMTTKIIILAGAILNLLAGAIKLYIALAQFYS